jgi:hypothetical protein
VGPIFIGLESEQKCAADWDAALCRGGMGVGGVYGGQQVTPPTPTPPLCKVASQSAAHFCSDSRLVKMGPTAVSKTLSTNLPYTPCKTPKLKYQYSSHGESLKSRRVILCINKQVYVKN